MLSEFACTISVRSGKGVLIQSYVVLPKGGAGSEDQARIPTGRYRMRNCVCSYDLKYDIQTG